MAFQNPHIIIVDDEKKGIDALKWKIQKLYPAYSVNQSFTNPEKALLYCISNAVDLVFLDIDMPKMNGLDFISKIKKLSNSPEVIFVTGHEEFVLEALRKAAFDYLLKPVDLDDLEEAMERYLSSRTMLSGTTNQPSTLRKIALPTSERIIYFEPDEIIYCESDSNYTMLHLEGDKKLLIARTLGKVELLLNDAFLRIHHSYIVNKEKVVSYQRGSGGNVTLRNGTTLPVSKNRKDELIMNMGG